jgi:hypothetical protein
MQSQESDSVSGSGRTLAVQKKCEVQVLVQGGGEIAERVEQGSALADNMNGSPFTHREINFSLASI